MSPDSAHLDQAVARALRANLEGLRRQSEELHQAIADLVAACSSSRPSNALPHIVRAQASAASVEAVLEVLSKFITRSAQSAPIAAMEEDSAPVVTAVSSPAPIPVRREAPARPAPVEPTPMSAAPAPITFEPPAPPVPEAIEADSSETIELIEAPSEEPAPVEPEPVHAAASESAPEEDDHASIWKAAEEAVAGKDVSATPAAEPASVSKDASFFDISALPAEQQEMHRRASRVAKVSMQDIKLLQPEAVKKGRETKDICIRLKDEIEKARKEYERRFRPILGQGVDYFHHWMVEVLGAGDESALGEYPYHPAATRQ